MKVTVTLKVRDLYKIHEAIEAVEEIKKKHPNTVHEVNIEALCKK